MKSPICRRTNERSILNLTISFDNLVPLPPTIWLTAVKHASLGFFQLNKNPRDFIVMFLDFVKVW